MRTRIEHVVIPEERYDREVYGCDFCEFEDTDKDVVLNHHAKHHAAKETIELNGEKFYRFESEEDAKLWLDPPNDYSHNDFTEVTWTGPGWYGNDTSWGKGRCRCGGCDYFVSELVPLDQLIERWRKNGTYTDLQLATFVAPNQSQSNPKENTR